MEAMQLRITGLTPLLVHNSRRFLNHADPASKELRAIGKKRGKTEEDLERMSDLEFVMGLYVDALNRPIIPGEVFEACFVSGAKKSKAGNTAKTSIIIDDAPLIYTGPATADELLNDPNFRDIRPVDINGSRINRTRPIFRKWSAQVQIRFDPSLVDQDQIVEWAKAAGSQCGVGDFRPRFGRFSVEVLNAA